MTDQNDSRKPDGRPTLPAAPTLNADQWDIPLAADTDGVIQLFQELLPTDEFQWILTDNGSSGCMFISTAIDKSLFQDDVAPALAGGNRSRTTGRLSSRPAPISVRYRIL